MPSQFKTKTERHKVLPGYPINEPFKNIEEVREYLSGDKVTCLLCGKSYKALGLHLVQIHDMSVDEYKGIYHIPWTYGLCGVASSKNYSAVVKRRIAEGYNPTSPELVEMMHKAMKEKGTRKEHFKDEIGKENLKNAEWYRPRRPKVKQEDGTYLSYTQDRYKRQAPRNSEEHKRRMRNRNRVLKTRKRDLPRGVYPWTSKGEYYYSVFTVDKVRHNLGKFETPEEAYEAYRMMYKEWYGVDL